MPGRFITLEGGEGVGKSTLAKALAQAIEATGQKVVRTREPGGTSGADQIRALLVTGENARWSALTETLLLTAARNDHLERVIRPALSRGDWVLCDRYTDSTFAYQAAGGGVSAPTVASLSEVIDALVPDLTIVLDLDPALGLGRAGSTAAGEARFEGRGAAYHAQVRAAFLKIAGAAPQRCVVLDASADRAEVLARARAAIADRLGITL